MSDIDQYRNQPLTLGDDAMSPVVALRVRVGTEIVETVR